LIDGLSTTKKRTNDEDDSSELSHETFQLQKPPLFQPTRKSIDLDEAMKHFARTSARCCDKARSGRDPWVNGGAVE
jgi:hypothetical protein